MPITRENYISGLRAIASFYADHPEVRLPCSMSVEREVFTNYFNSGAEEIAIVARLLKPLSKIYPKSDTATEMFLEREMAPGIFLRFQTERNRICKLVTKTIEAHTVDVPEQTIQVWECDDSLLERAEALDLDAILARTRGDQRSLAEIRDLILAGLAEMPMETAVSAQTTKPILTRAGADRLNAATGIRFSAGDPLPIIEAEDQEQPA